jgi:hypothetical protein
MKLNFLCVSVASVLFSGPVLAHEVVTGQCSNVDAAITSADNWTTIRFATVVINHVGVHGCVATASADVFNPPPPGVENQYRFVLTRNDATPATNTGSERVLELIDNPTINDPNSDAVSTNLHFTGLTSTNGLNGTGSHTFRFLGRKVQAGDTNTTVLDACLSVICIHTP